MIKNKDIFNYFAIITILQKYLFFNKRWDIFNILIIKSNTKFQKRKMDDESTSKKEPGATLSERSEHSP